MWILPRKPLLLTRTMFPSFPFLQSLPRRPKFLRCIFSSLFSIFPFLFSSPHELLPLFSFRLKRRKLLVTEDTSSPSRDSAPPSSDLNPQQEDVFVHSIAEIVVKLPYYAATALLVPPLQSVPVGDDEVKAYHYSSSESSSRDSAALQLNQQRFRRQDGASSSMVGTGVEAEMQNLEGQTPMADEVHSAPSEMEGGEEEEISHISPETDNPSFEARPEDPSIDSPRPAFNVTPITASEELMADSAELTPKPAQASRTLAISFSSEHILPHLAAGFETILEPASRAPTETFPVQSMLEQRDHPSPNHPSEGLAIYGHSPGAE
ncbi:uncharacterized protein LOC114322103 [Camellia sinensis]|uniref:uncharacterized protein LOC114322103 n=1 Tax=Camellia sinensis TaxID=4442 RepID=UPI001036F29A|nr:uncharacterized protein LOC114322103 [Camellia sinensis]